MKSLNFSFMTGTSIVERRKVEGKGKMHSFPTNVISAAGKTPVTVTVLCGIVLIL